MLAAGLEVKVGGLHSEVEIGGRRLSRIEMVVSGLSRKVEAGGWRWELDDGWRKGQRRRPPRRGGNR
jgi:hypothetical protein